MKRLAAPVLPTANGKGAGVVRDMQNTAAFFFFSFFLFANRPPTTPDPTAAAAAPIDTALLAAPRSRGGK